MAPQPPLFVLIHAPLVGPYTWALTAQALARLGASALCPELKSDPVAGMPFWEQHATSVAAALAAVAPDRPLILVAHSGSGPLLPAIRAALRQPVAAYIFADAGFPEGGKSRMDLMATESQEAADAFRRSAVGGWLPVWKAQDLREVIPDDAVRARFAAEFRPLPLAVYEEPLPVFAGWPDAPGAYLRFGPNPAYESSARRAEALGWPVRMLPGEHFEMLVHPAIVAQALVDLSHQLAIPGLEGTQNA